MHSKTNEKDPVRKHDRVLEIYTRLISGETIRKQELADEYGVAPRSIQRDIDSIRDFYSNRAIDGDDLTEIKYDRLTKGYHIINSKSLSLTNAELFTVAKIILETRSLSKKELKGLLTKLIDTCLSPVERKKMSDLLNNEIFHYVEPQHKKNMINFIWTLGEAVYQHRMIQLEYQKASGEISNSCIKPVGIMGSRYYFYLIAYIGDKDKKYPGYPTVYRVDRIKSYRITDEIFHVPYKDRFEEGEFRKRIPFMYGGPLTKKEFIYTGPDINSVLDRLPASDFKKLPNGDYLIKSESYGTVGFKMWLLSQGTWVKAIAPDDFVEEIKNEITAQAKYYNIINSK